MIDNDSDEKWANYDEKIHSQLVINQGEIYVFFTMNQPSNNLQKSSFHNGARGGCGKWQRWNPALLLYSVRALQDAGSTMLAYYYHGICFTQAIIIRHAKKLE